MSCEIVVSEIVVSEIVGDRRLGDRLGVTLGWGSVDLCLPIPREVHAISPVIPALVSSPHKRRESGTGEAISSRARKRESSPFVKCQNWGPRWSLPPTPIRGGDETLGALLRGRGGGDDRAAVLELGLLHRPGAAGGAGAQRVDSHLELGAGGQRLGRPAVARQAARRPAFEVPHRRLIAGLDLQQDEGVRARELELLHGADELDRVLLVEHGERVVGKNRSREPDQGSSCQQGSHSQPHASLPLYVALVRCLAVSSVLFFS